MRKFEDYDVFSAARSLVAGVYSATARFPSSERDGLCGQLRRAAISIPSNFAEGAGRESAREFARFVSIAIGSATEVECQIILANDLGMLDDRIARDLREQLVLVRRMLIALLRRLRASK